MVGKDTPMDNETSESILGNCMVIFICTGLAHKENIFEWKTYGTYTIILDLDWMYGCWKLYIYARAYMNSYPEHIFEINLASLQDAKSFVRDYLVYL